MHHRLREWGMAVDEDTKKTFDEVSWLFSGRSGWRRRRGRRRRGGGAVVREGGPLLSLFLLGVRSSFV